MAGFQRVAEEEASDQVIQHPAAAQQQAALGVQMLSLALRTLSQKAIVALGNMFTAATVFSAWWLWQQSPPNPSISQLVGLGLYALFILALHVIRR